MMRKLQSGVMLLEALIAILIFSMGVLGLVGMQATAVKASRDARFRTDAGLLANDLVGQMRTANRTGASLQTNFQGGSGTDGATYTLWAQRVAATLPGTTANPPLVTVAPGNPGPPMTSSAVSITVRWQAPSEVSASNYRVVVEII